MGLKLSEKQRQFVFDRHRFTAFVGGVRSGKTFAGTVKAIRMALRRKRTGAVVAPTYTMIRDVILPLWRKILPAGSVTRFSRTQNKLWLKNGSVVLFRSAEIPERLYGLTLDWFHIDEAAIVSRKVWDTLYSRVISRKGYGFITTTPNGHNWVWELYSNSCISTTFAKTIDNPLIDPEEVERAKKLLDPKFFRQQYEASFEAYLGQVYDDFGEQNISHLALRPDLPVYLACDFGWRNPTAILWAQILENGDIYIFDEVVESFMTPELIAQTIKGSSVKLPSGRAFKAKVDYDKISEIVTGFEAAQSRQEAGGLAIIDILRNLGIQKIRIISGSVARGVLMVRAKILGANGTPHIFVSPHCKRLIADFRGYHYPENTKGTAFELPQKDGIHDHTMDALRYLVMALEKKKSNWII